MVPEDHRPQGHLVILFEDAHCLAVSKPAGLLTQGWSGGEGSLEDLVRAYLRSSSATEPYLGTVHRLDRPVSGVIIWAKTPRAARRLGQQFADRTTIKEYRALVSGPPIGFQQECWEDWLAESFIEPGHQVITGAARGKRAITLVEPWMLADLPRDVRGLRLRPRTGRTHQLRVQASSRAWPILGDSAYGSNLPFPEGIALHARSLTIAHPVRNRLMTFQAPYPGCWDDFAAITETS